MPDICDLILAQHHDFRTRFAELDTMREASADDLRPKWEYLAWLLEIHAEAEERLFYPRLLEHGAEPVEETEDAVTDHAEITEAVERARGAELGSQEWWEGVDAARAENSSHTAEEERGALADFRRNAPVELREELGDEWTTFFEEHADVEREPKDLVDYVAEHGDEEQVAEAEAMAAEEE